MMVHPIFLMPTVMMSPLPVRALFHQSSQVVPPDIPILYVLPSPVCATPVPSGVAPSTHATPSLFPTFSIFLSALVRSSYRVLSSSPLLPKILSTQVGMLETCDFVMPPCHQ